MIFNCILLISKTYFKIVGKNIFADAFTYAWTLSIKIVKNHKIATSLNSSIFSLFDQNLDAY